MHPSHPSSGRLTALGIQLIEIHDWLREELARLRASLDSPTGGDALTRELRAHCVGFCAAWTGTTPARTVARSEPWPNGRPSCVRCWPS